MSQIPNELRSYAAGRTQVVAKRVVEAMAQIKKEIDDNGVYPLNGGRLTSAEVCRRAGVKEVTLQGYKHKETTRIEVLDFVRRMNGSIKLTRTRRIAGIDSVAASKRQLEEMAMAYHLDMLRLSDLESRVRELELENRELRTRLE